MTVEQRVGDYTSLITVTITIVMSITIIMDTCYRAAYSS